MIRTKMNGGGARQTLFADLNTPFDGGLLFQIHVYIISIDKLSIKEFMMRNYI